MKMANSIGLTDTTIIDKADHLFYNMMVPSTTAIIIVIKTAARHMIYI